MFQVEVFWVVTARSVVAGYRGEVKIQAAWTSETFGILPQHYTASQGGLKMEAA
jgi:hypothetical protein